ncbi:5-formyltetrahydrofolate cyclo-ligase [Xylaria bambusicola]|uniref:5-formyltetrahydrofolate cyclo-ligase n=1 Tax=Xylaria bambusicola TaxID=326684 RepID=UPI002007AD25|nr:5-formyltetrahydrofolate cyclo-ligase [Xylaria bambusicola]KAI0521180.1 5-formyltetrahydrofolate cyclo-ligase [Xylaria bambusicola]
MNSSTLHVAKTRLRSLMKQRLSTLSPDVITAQSNAAFDALSRFKPYQDAKSLGVYLSMPGCELQTDSIVRHALASGKRVFVPYLHKSGLPPGEGPMRLMDMVSLRDVEDYESLQRDKWGIPSVDGATVHERQRSIGELGGESATDASLDLILMPGVAFDFDPETGAMRRLGHGKGFYDYFLHRYALAVRTEKTSAPSRDGSSVLLYALALKEQLLSPTSGEAVPVGPHDQPLDGIVLGDGQIKQSISNSID